MDIHPTSSQTTITVLKPSLACSLAHHSRSRRLNSLGNAIGLPALDLLARLLDLLENGLVAQAVGGMDLGGLVLEGDGVGFDACWIASVRVVMACWMMGAEGLCCCVG